MKETNNHSKWNKMEYHGKMLCIQLGNSDCDLCLSEKLCIIKNANNLNNIKKEMIKEANACILIL